MDTTALIVRAVIQTDARTDNGRTHARDAMESTGYCGSSRAVWVFVLSQATPTTLASPGGQHPEQYRELRVSDKPAANKYFVVV